MTFRGKILVCLLVVSVVFANARDRKIKTDSLFNDTVDFAEVKETEKKTNVAVDTLKLQTFKPDPERVIWMGAIIPGYGQFLNRRYWKIPIVYAGFLGCAYAITWNSQRYQAYRNGYRDIIDNNDLTDSFNDLILEGYTIDDYGGISSFTTQLKTKMDRFRYNRDLSIIVSVAYYAITLVDAFVDAQLYDFDISPDLSLNLRPALIDNQYSLKKTAGIQLSLRIK